MDICDRCLVIPNSQTIVRATFIDDQNLLYMEVCEDPTSPVFLKKWVEDRMCRKDCIFEVDGTNRRFLPISTWHGDPVCVVHLWTLTEAEMRDGYGARALRPR